MSRTYKDRKTNDDWKIPEKKLTPYVKNKNKGVPKFIVDLGLGNGITTLGKLITKNANRSFKKGKRQEIKLEIKKELENYES